MLCVTIEKKPTIGILYAPFTDTLDENSLLETHKPSVDEIIVSRSHAGHTYEILKSIYNDKPYKIIPAAGSSKFQIFPFFIYLFIEVLQVIKQFRY